MSAAPMTQRLAATLPQRLAVRDFLAFAATRGALLTDQSALIPQAMTRAEQEAMLDAHYGIDRAQLAAERAAQLTPGAECAC
jgi:hypothetical protein